MVKGVKGVKGLSEPATRLRTLRVVEGFEIPLPSLPVAALVGVNHEALVSTAAEGPVHEAMQVPQEDNSALWGFRV